MQNVVYLMMVCMRSVISFVDGETTLVLFKDGGRDSVVSSLQEVWYLLLGFCRFPVEAGRVLVPSGPGSPCLSLPALLRRRCGGQPCEGLGLGSLNRRGGFRDARSR